MPCWLVRHKWRVQGAQKLDVFWNAKREGALPYRLETKVLYRCVRCSEVVVETVDGHWTLEQLVLGEEKLDGHHHAVGGVAER